MIGAGQAGLSAAYHLQRRGFLPAGRTCENAAPAVVQDARAHTLCWTPKPGPAERGGTAGKAFGWPPSMASATCRESRSRTSTRPSRVQRSFHATSGTMRTARAEYPAARESPLGSREDGDPDGRLRIETSGGQLVRTGGHQRHRHLDQAVLADLPGTVQLPGQAAARGRLRGGRRIPRAARHCGGRRHFRRRAAGRNIAGHHHKLVHPPGTGVARRRVSTGRRVTTPSPSSKSGSGRDFLPRAWCP